MHLDLLMVNGVSYSLFQVRTAIGMPDNKPTCDVNGRTFPSDSFDPFRYCGYRSFGIRKAPMICEEISQSDFERLKNLA